MESSAPVKPEVTIRTYTTDYQQEVIALILHVQCNEFGVIITAEQQPDLKTIPDFYQKENGNFWVALHDNKVVGTIALIDIGNSQVALRKMFVAENFRGKEFKTGQKLLDVSLAWMISKKINHVFLGTLDIFKAAQNFYRKNGFEEIPMNSLPQNFPKMKLDNTFFKKDIINVSNIEILDYQPEHQPWFEKFNRDWIEELFWMEPIDIAVLQQPEKYILEQGGIILIASVNKEIAGTVGLKRNPDEVYEFTKMAVDKKFRGQKVGLALAEAAIHRAKRLHASKIILYSNTKQIPAIALYRKLGFVEIPNDGLYERGNIKMELQLP